MSKNECIRNGDPSQIDRHGFVELSKALPGGLIEDIRKEAIDQIALPEGEETGPSTGKRKRQQGQKSGGRQKGEEEVDVSDELLERMDHSMQRSPRAISAMQEVYGKLGQNNSESHYEGFALETPKVLGGRRRAVPAHPQK